MVLEHNLQRRHDTCATHELKVRNKEREHKGIQEINKIDDTMMVDVPKMALTN